jgi:DNA (cytosine-5)-methyltransferase 1
VTHVDLFSGIGGFALAATWVWGDEYENVGHSDIEPYACKVYHKHFPESRCLGDITKIEWREVVKISERVRRNGSKWKVETEVRGFGKSRSRTDGGIHLLTGGFPCQPFSVAGKRRGKEDNRHLWPEMLRAIREVRPRWVIGENVAGIIRMELDQVLSDLEIEGYQTEPFLIPVCALNAPHRRDRVWIVARSTQNSLDSGNGGRGNGDTQRCERALQTQRPNSEPQHPTNHTEDNELPLADLTIKRLQRINNKPPRRSRLEQFIGHANREWLKSWLEVATRLCRVDDGVPNRVDRLKGLGNAIVPQVAQVIMEAIKDIDILKELK